MNSKQNPIRTTILYGLACGLIFTPLAFFLGPILFWSKALKLILWFYLAGYSVFLIKWGSGRVLQIIFPVSLLLALLFFPLPLSAYLFLLLGILSWIRSGICFQHSFFRAITAEIIVCAGGAALVASFTPFSSICLAIGIFLFFLVQSIYFLIFPLQNDGFRKEKIDPFDKALRRVENILGNSI